LLPTQSRGSRGCRSFRLVFGQQLLDLQPELLDVRLGTPQLLQHAFEFFLKPLGAVAFALERGLGPLPTANGV